MKIVVVGGYGDIGSCVVEKLIEFTSHQVTVAGRNLQKARAICSTFKGYVGALQADVENRSTLTAAFENFDLVINCAGPFFKYGANVAIAAIETRTHYIDICDDPDPIPKLFALNDAARRAGVTVVTGMGWNPGISNLAVRLGANLLDEIEHVEMAWVVGSGDAKGLAALKHTLHGVTGEVPMFKDGKQVLLPAWDDMEMVEFPAPLGELPEFLFGHPEPLTLPRAIKARNIFTRGGIDPPWNNNALRVIRSLRLTNSRGKIDTVAGIIHRVQRIFSIGGVEHSALRIDVIGKKDGQSRHLVFNMLDRIRPLTAIPCAVGAMMLLDGEIAQKGVMSPETCIDPVRFFDRISDKGVKIMREGRL
ncbi:saccharopine dehydrogenase NADP-binding domain-containing protein [Candidatus Poribacteria bacterium]|nr:saccharopine dehydrogenase NADP-binding domain-containing protein [Candidatus Poribacteria bacterium]